MGCFKLPIGICNEIETLISKFWCGQHGERRKIHWLRWDELTKSKLVGGMGFQDVAIFNDSLLAKQAWILLHNKDSLFYKVLEACFFPNCLIIEAKDSRSGSYAWRSILKGRDVIQRGAWWWIGDGKKVRYGRIIGSLGSIPHKFALLWLPLWRKRLLINFLMNQKESGTRISLMGFCTRGGRVNL